MRFFATQSARRGFDSKLPPGGEDGGGIYALLFGSKANCACPRPLEAAKFARH